MGKKMKVFFAILVVVTISMTGAAKQRQKQTETGSLKQLVVRVHNSPQGPQFEMRSYDGLKKGEANYWLAEIKLRECADCQVIPIIDDDVPLGAITQISEMAINAGFKDIRPFIYWKKTGNMAEIQFGPPIRFTADAERIELRLEKAK